MSHQPQRTHKIDDPAIALAYRYYRDAEENSVFQAVSEAEKAVKAAKEELEKREKALQKAQVALAESRAHFAANVLQAAGLQGFRWGVDEAFAYSDDGSVWVVVRKPKQ